MKLANILTFFGYCWASLGMLSFIIGVTQPHPEVHQKVPFLVMLSVYVFIFVFPGLVIGALGSILKTLKEIQKSEVYIETEAE